MDTNDKQDNGFILQVLPRSLFTFFFTFFFFCMGDSWSFCGKLGEINNLLLFFCPWEEGRLATASSEAFPHGPTAHKKKRKR